MTRFRDHYDWVVLGDHPGALLSGALTAKLGLSTLIVPKFSTSTFAKSNAGRILDPETNFLLGDRVGEAEGILLRCLQSIGAPASEAGGFRAVEFQVLTPVSRIRFSQNAQDLHAEAMREFGKTSEERLGIVKAIAESQGELSRFWYRTPERLTIATDKNVRKERFPKSLDQVRATLRQQSALPNGLKKQWYSGSVTPAEVVNEFGILDWPEICSGASFLSMGSLVYDRPAVSPTLPEFLQNVALAQSGCAYQGGLRSYRELLLRLAQRSGAQVADQECRRVFLQNGRFAGVQLSQSGNMITADGATLGCPISQMEMIATKSGRATRRLKSSPRPVGWKFTVSVMVHSEALPPGSSSLMVWQERGAPPLELEVTDPKERGFRESGKIIHLRTVMPFVPESIQPEYQRLISTRMFKQLTNLIPFVEFHVLKMDPDFRSQSSAPFGIPNADTTHGSVASAFSFKSLEEIPGELLCYSGKGTGSDSGIEGLFIGSPEAYPELGSLGPTLAALESAAWAAHRAGLPGPLQVHVAPQTQT